MHGSQVKHAAVIIGVPVMYSILTYGTLPYRYSLSPGQTRKHCCDIVSCQCFAMHVSQSGQTLGNISEKHRETSNVSEIGRKHFCFPGSKFCFRNNVSTGGQTGKHFRKHRESQMFPQQCFLVCPRLYGHNQYVQRYSEYNGTVKTHLHDITSRIRINACKDVTFQITP